MGQFAEDILSLWEVDECTERLEPSVLHELGVLQEIEDVPADVPVDKEEE